MFNWILLGGSDFVKLDDTDGAEEDENDVNDEADHIAHTDTDSHDDYWRKNRNKMLFINCFL